jgi:two-component system, LytTR family, sensor histidine kinase LytS
LRQQLNISELLIRHRWLWHIGFWCLYGASRAYPYFLTVAYYDKAYLEFMLITEVSLFFLVLLTLRLYRRFCTELHYKRYFALGIGLWIGYVALVICFQKYYLAAIPEIANAAWSAIFFNALSKYLFLFVLLTMGKYFKDNFIQQHYEKEERHLKVQSELQNLKAQISPHFLFNTMNNFYGLAVEKSDKLPELMVRLSELLRYSLYETNHITVPLSNEIAYLNNYIELEKIRLEDTLVYEFEVAIAPNMDFKIAPLILVVFVENAFKHAKNVKNDVIRIKILLSVSDAGLLYFEMNNNCLPEPETVLERNSNGIGLENVKKRLEVLYPNTMHHLETDHWDNNFQVRLTINLAR